MKYAFHTVKVCDIDGTDLKADLHKIIGVTVFRQAQNLDLIEKARTMNRGEEVELEKVEATEVRNLIDSPAGGLLAFTKKAALDYMDEVEKQPIPTEKK